MTNKENTAVDSRSHSQIKREQRKKEVSKAKHQAAGRRVVFYVVIAAIIALIAWGISSIIIKESSKVQQSDNYSAGLAENGYIQGVKASDKLELPEYKGIEVAYSDIEYTDDKIDADIESVLGAYQYVSDDENLVVADGDVVNIAYVGTTDGEAFEGGTSDSYDLTIGSGTFIGDFEQQLIGAKNGTTVEVNVTLPDNYPEEIAGKDAVFTVDIKGIYVTPEFTDEFVAEKLSDYATTVEGYREYQRKTKEAENLKTYVMGYLKDNTTVKSYPNKYVKLLKSIQKYDDMQTYEYMNQMYQSYLGYKYYNSFEDYVGMSEDEYNESLKDVAKETCKENMIYQAIVEKEGAVADAAFYKGYLLDGNFGEGYYESQVATAGEPFVLQQAIREKALQIVCDSAVIK